MIKEQISPGIKIFVEYMSAFLEQSIQIIYIKLKLSKIFDILFIIKSFIFVDQLYFYCRYLRIRRKLLLHNVY